MSATVIPYGVDENEDEDSEFVLYEQNPVFLIICGLVILFVGCFIILFVIFKKKRKVKYS